jgi:hypothetical protein
VEIEFEEYLEFTSEEEGGLGEGSQKERSPFRNKEGGFSVVGSNDYYLVPKGSGKGKKRDHLKHFEKKMS